MNKFEFFTPLMHKNEYKFLEKFLTPNDILLEYGSGSGSIYFSGLVKKAISIEHDIEWYDTIKKSIDNFNITNLDLYYVPGKHVENQKLFRHIAFEDYIKFPKTQNLEFTKVLIDGRARKHCAEFISEIIDESIIVFIHDFNFNNVEGYIDEDYFSDILKHFDVVDFESTGRGIIALRKKSNPTHTTYNTRYEMFKSFDKNKIIAEIGVFRGDFSKFIYDEINPKELHLIDIFEGVTHSGIDDSENVITINLNDSYKNLTQIYNKNKNIFIYKGLSDKILSKFNDNYFDIVFIDADHSYESVKKDLEISYSKVKIGGIICGHDYVAKNHVDVYLAVNKFCIEKNLKIDYLTNENYASFGIIKTH